MSDESDWKEGDGNDEDSEEMKDLASFPIFFSSKAFLA